MVKRLVFLCVALTCLLGFAVSPAHAMFGLEKLFSFSSGSIAPKAHAQIAGQKVRVFHLQKAHPEDLMMALQNYLDGFHSQGSLIQDNDNNSIVLTDDPDSIQRVEVLVKEMDQTYDNPNAKARQVLAFQQMRKAIRDLRLQTAGAGPSPSAVASQPAGAASSSGPSIAAAAPVGVTPVGNASIPLFGFENDAVSPMKILEERPPLESFLLIGWYRDDQGMVVVLKNQGQRYFYRHGRLVYGRLTNKDVLKGITGNLQGDNLILRDEHHSVLKLSLKPRNADDQNSR